LYFCRRAETWRIDVELRLRNLAGYPDGVHGFHQSLQADVMIVPPLGHFRVFRAFFFAFKFINCPPI
jgi:hypothetical protein